MSGSRLARDVREMLDTDLESFGDAVRREAHALEEAIADGAFDNPQAIVGLEYEFYGVADEDATLRRGLSNDEAATYLRPLRQRVDRSVTPASWKRDRVRAHVAEGKSFADAVHAMQREYVDRQRDSLLSGGFASWPDVPLTVA